MGEPEPKPCRRCGSIDIPEHRRRRYDWLCRECHGADTTARYDIYRRTSHGREVRRQSEKRYRLNRIAAVRRCTLETVIRCQSSRCVVCNVAPWTLARYRLGPMHVGHLVPGDEAGGFEPMCKKCNTYLGARKLTAETGREVLRRSRRYWSRLRMRDEAWMHADVDERGYGFGGVNEPPGRQRKLEAFGEEQRARREQREGAGGQPDPSGDGLPVVGQDGGVVLANAPQERNPED
jgi:hypothetical protein